MFYLLNFFNAGLYLAHLDANTLDLNGCYQRFTFFIKDGIVAYLLDNRFNSLTKANCLAKIHPANSYSGLPSSLN